MQLIAILILLVGVFFFTAGTAGMLRFPDVHSRLHAMTKADNLALALVLIGTAMLSQDWVIWIQSALIWVLIVITSTNGSYLIANAAARRDDQ